MKSLRILWAEFRCNVYLLFRGMWKGEVEFRSYDASDKLITIGTTKGYGNFREVLNKAERTFYIDEEVLKSAQEKHSKRNAM